MPSGPSTAARTPFVLLVVVLLGGGLITLLLLNSALNQGSFKLRDLKARTTELTDEEQALQRDVDDYSAPDALERRARELGMVPGGSPAFLDPDGKVRGERSVASAPPEPSPSPTPPRTPAGPGTNTSQNPPQSTAQNAPQQNAQQSPAAPPSAPPSATAPTTSGR
ncbi:septum formation initiator family protein [Streptomyces sp. NPDC048604]|uniref:FtsB family cell division protein n=1 Tax=Streptomyces sp. NPDC048604 TaxID=3365578 RepID=UPI003714617D